MKTLKKILVMFLFYAIAFGCAVVPPFLIAYNAFCDFKPCITNGACVADFWTTFVWGCMFTMVVYLSIWTTNNILKIAKDAKTMMD